MQQQKLFIYYFYIVCSYIVLSEARIQIQASSKWRFDCSSKWSNRRFQSKYQLSILEEASSCPNNDSGGQQQATWGNPGKGECATWNRGRGKQSYFPLPQKYELASHICLLKLAPLPGAQIYQARAIMMTSCGTQHIFLRNPLRLIEIMRWNYFWGVFNSFSTSVF